MMRANEPSEDRTIWRVAPLLLWTGVVLGLSSDAFADDSTSGVVLPLLRWLFPSADASLLAAMHYTLRKLAHVTEYAALGVLALFAIRGLWRPARTIRPAVFLPLAYCLAVATADEIHQSATARRSGAVSDVALDLAGSATGVWVYVTALSACTARAARSLSEAGPPAGL
jgi:VanZ family protein